MFIVLFHDEDLYYFIGVAHTYTEAEDIIAQDEANVGKSDKPCYTIAETPVGYACAINIADYVEGNPYKKGE